MDARRELDDHTSTLHIGSKIRLHGLLNQTLNGKKGIVRNILNPDKMMNGETLTVLLEWTIHGSPRNDTLGLPMAQSKT